MLNSEKILSCRSLIKEDINFRKENIQNAAEESFESINNLFDGRADETMEAVLNDDARDCSGLCWEKAN